MEPSSFPVVLRQYTYSKEVIRNISFEPISKRLTLKSYYEPGVKLVRIGVIATFGQATTRKIFKTWIVTSDSY